MSVNIMTFPRFGILDGNSSEQPAFYAKNDDDYPVDTLSSIAPSKPLDSCTCTQVSSKQWIPPNRAIPAGLSYVLGFNFTLGRNTIFNCQANPSHKPLRNKPQQLGSGMVWVQQTLEIHNPPANQPITSYLHIADLGPSEGQEDEATNVLTKIGTNVALGGLELIIPGKHPRYTGNSQFVCINLGCYSWNRYSMIGLFI